MSFFFFILQLFSFFSNLLSSYFNLLCYYCCLFVFFLSLSYFVFSLFAFALLCMFICIIIIQKTNPNIIIVYEQNKILFFIYKKIHKKNGRRKRHCDGFLSLIINPKKTNTHKFNNK